MAMVLPAGPMISALTSASVWPNRHDAVAHLQVWHRSRRALRIMRQGGDLEPSFSACNEPNTRLLQGGRCCGHTRALLAVVVCVLLLRWVCCKCTALAGDKLTSDFIGRMQSLVRT